MPTYQFECDLCDCEFYLIERDGSALDLSEIQCVSCGTRSHKLIGFSQSDEMILFPLMGEIERLSDRIKKLEGEENEPFDA